MPTEKNIPQNNPFKVPNGYFDALSNNIQDECYREEQGFFAMFQLQKWATALAIIAVFYVGFKNANTTPLQSADVYTLVSDEVMHWDEYLLYQYVESIEEQNDYIDYLLEQEIDLTSILNDL